MKKTGRNRGLTLRDVVNHITAFKQEVNVRFDRMEKESQLLRSDFRAHCKGVDDLDFRVQDIEDAKLPKRVKAIEKKLTLAA
ncbi:hypothetical protein FJZ27_04935 [Candidatus Peribacteria bacterium]|nr:hypothetical protein [Candidatus Peribacteria bacterium]MBM3300976.1 hypothetical protein [Deltaproteobacteria bacterium]